MSDCNCPICGDVLIMKMGGKWVTASIEVWNENHLLTDAKRDNDGNPIPNCQMCGKVLREQGKKDESTGAGL